MELTSSWEHGGRFEDAAILKGRRKQETKTCNKKVVAITICNQIVSFYCYLKRENIFNKKLRLIYFELLQIFFFRLNHAKYQTVSFSHALSVR